MQRSVQPQKLSLSRSVGTGGRRGDEGPVRGENARRGIKRRVSDEPGCGGWRTLKERRKGCRGCVAVEE